MSVIEKAVAILRKDVSTSASQNMNQSSVGGSDSQRSRVNSNNLVCQLDFDALRESGYLTNDNTDTKLAEEFRLIKRPLLSNAFGKGVTPIDSGNLIMITSSLPGEGKTFTSINMALSIALERDTTVLLVDADVVKPKLSALFGLGKQPGLIDVLDDSKMSLADVIINTDNPKLRIIPAGQIHDHSTEILASERMQLIAEELSVRYRDRVIIFDAPPFLISSQAKVLAGLVGQIMVVVEAGVTNTNAIQETTAQLGKDKVIGMILNKCKINKRSQYGGYYGIYGE